MIHLADQIFVLDPIYMHHMYPYEHHMVVMKGYVCNRAHLEWSMIESYTTEEVIKCCIDYKKDGNQIHVFKCQWVKHPHGIEVDEYGFTIVDLRNMGHKDEPWVLASTVAQVFYIFDPKDEKKHIVVPGKQRVVGVDNVDDEEEYNQFDEVPFIVDTTRINIIETKISYSNVIPYACTDGEGKLIHV
jgi:hypothetical protein